MSQAARRYEWVFLDAGETLFQVVSPQQSFGDLLAELGYPLPPETVVALVNRARDEALAADHYEPGADYAISAERARARRERLLAAILRGVGVRQADYATCQAAVWEAFAGPRFFGLYPETPGVLERLRAAGYRLGIISNWEPRLPQLCRSHDLAQHFEFILASEAEGYAKPGSHLFRRALELARIEPHRAVHVGDSFRDDVLGATRVGIPAVLLDRGSYYTSLRWQPTINTLADLPALLASDFSRDSSMLP